jgi:mono/diheme cytochrome c family protein
MSDGLKRFGVVVLGAALALGTAEVARLSAQSTSQQTAVPPLVISSMYGRDLFQFYCATCHGIDGTGHGPAATALRMPPPDLTDITLQNGGMFPASRIASIVSGGSDAIEPAHGSREMPVWGPIFRGLDRNDARTRVRIANIVAYIESIQRKE